MVYITFVSVIGLAVERLISRPLPAELGGSSPFAHVLMMGGASVVALYLLRHMRAALGGAGKAALGGAQGLRGVLGGKTPWEKMDDKAAAADPQQILGPAQEGFDPVPGETGSGSGGSEGGGAPPAPNSQPGDGAGAPAVTPSAPGLDPVVSPDLAGALDAPRQPQRQTRRANGGRRSVAAAAQPALDLGEGSWASSAAPEVEPITDAGRHGASWEHGAPPRSSYVGHDADIPI